MPENIDVETVGSLTSPPLPKTAEINEEKPKKQRRTNWPKNKADLTEEQRELIIDSWNEKRQKRKESHRRKKTAETESSSSENEEVKDELFSNQVKEEVKSELDILTQNY